MLTTVDEIKDFVQYLLGDEGAKAPFVYEHWGGGTERSGRFLHPLILATFSHHVEKVLLPVEGLGLSSSGFPHGALIHSILAVNWALRFWITGEYVKPKKDRKTFYSKDNWGDMKMWTMDPETQEKKLVSILRTSRWNKSVYKLSAEDWRRLRDRAMEYVQDELVEIPDTQILASSGVSEADDFELVSD